MGKQAGGIDRPGRGRNPRATTTPSAGCSSPSAGSCISIATACWDRSTTPKTCCRSAQLKAWRSLRTFDGQAPASAPGCSAWRRTPASTPWDAPPARASPGHQRRPDPALGLGDQRHDIPWLEPYPDAICRAWTRGSGGAAGERAAGVRPGARRSSTPATGGADTPQCPRLVSGRSSLGTRDVGGGRHSSCSGRGPPSPTRLQEDSAPMEACATDSAPRWLGSTSARGGGGHRSHREHADVDAVHAMPPWSAWSWAGRRCGVLYAGYRVWGAVPGYGVSTCLRRL